MIAHRPHDPRRGFTLVELLIAMVLLVMVGAAFWTTVTGVERSTRTQTEIAAMHGAIRGGMQIVASDLQELYSNAAGATTDSDIESMTSNAITYKAMRGLGLVCEASTTQIKIRSDTLWSGLHDPAFPPDAGLLIFVDDDETTRADDSWFTVPITGAVTSGACGPDLAWVVPVNITGTAVDTIQNRVKWPGAPVRTYERMELGLTTADGRSWLGIRSVSGGEASLVPLAGPVAAVNGVTFEYFQADGATAAATANLVKLIRVRLIGETERSVNRALSSAIETVIDTLTLRVELRNSR